jgi:hypothetical protein
MIDQKWLDATLRFTFPSGERLEGVLGVGGSHIVLKYVDSEGSTMAVKLRRDPFFLASYLHELPNGFTPTPQYDLDRLNRKLGGLVGDVQLYMFVSAYHELFSAVIEPFRENRLLLDSVRGETEEGTRNIRFLFQTPVMANRLDEIATSSHDPKDREWAVGSRHSIERLGPEDPELRPSTLLDNPLLVWAGAALGGFFTVSELPRAATAITDAMARVPDDLVVPFAQQASVMFGWLDYRDPDSVSTYRVATLFDATAMFSWTFMPEGQKLAPEQPRLRFLEMDHRPAAD